MLAMVPASPVGYVCNRCQITVPVVKGIPRFVDTVDAGFDKRWQEHPKPQATTEAMFWLKTGWSRRDLLGKTILDAGCGCGRFSAVAAANGAQVISLDGSAHAVESAIGNIPGSTGHIAQIDLLQPLPLIDNSVDAAFCLGVLQHTACPSAAFANVARTVKPGGSLAVWLYACPVTDPDLLPVMDFMHAITRACPPAALHSACADFAVKLRDTYHGQWTPLHQVVRVSNSPDDEECVSDTFDWHTPRYRSWHTVAEVSRWFADAGYTVDFVGEFPVSVRGFKTRG